MVEKDIKNSDNIENETSPEEMKEDNQTESEVNNVKQDTEDKSSTKAHDSKNTEENTDTIDSENDTTEKDEEMEMESEYVEDEHQTDKNKKLKKQIKDLTAEKRDLYEQLQRCKADTLNTKRRLEEEKKKGIERAKVDFIESLLPLCDSFQMAMGNEEVWGAVDEKWRKGVEGIQMQLNTVLKEYQVEKVEPTGEEFDPKQHEAVSEEEVTDDKQHEKIVKVIQAGYIMRSNDKEILIRPPRVVVGKKREVKEQ